MRLRTVWGVGLGLTLAASVAACGGGQESGSTSKPAAPAAAAGGSKVDPATAGGIKGMVSIEGTAPANEPIQHERGSGLRQGGERTAGTGNLSRSAPTASRSPTCSST